ncbi:SGNH/GDSL hydrolase family protein [Rathayibacter sp. VKM Ac-2803]|uniref:SGNH/GDSL hydrolase family protein n=1 Tax=Rathayibacter sp. VKM Ac-2803 TaxID=2609256 RepID=UPI0013568064|nr:SGNH/GDSL hydrolase family protein [Rathayibacter sp. VKM Ac-2803]MWV47956.1 SGNH/GDSL hydrolase family protein [Rathayibacter sp. VKM Ac-2803]
MSTTRTIAALGSSFAAGPGIEPIVDAAALRSGRNYAHQLAERLDAELVDLTVSGATTANVLDAPQAVGDGTERPPQVEGVPETAAVVTITAGGNDLQFIGAMAYVAWHRLEPESPMLALFGDAFADGIPEPTADAVEGATAGLVRVVERVRARAPRCRVLLVDYLTVLDRASLGRTPFTAEELERLLDIQDAIGTVFRDAAARTGADLILASELSEGHALGSADPWVQPFHREMSRAAGSFHPNERGMTAIAEELERVLRA